MTLVPFDCTAHYIKSHTQALRFRAEVQVENALQVSLWYAWAIILNDNLRTAVSGVDRGKYGNLTVLLFFNSLKSISNQVLKEVPQKFFVAEQLINSVRQSHGQLLWEASAK